MQMQVLRDLQAKRRLEGDGARTREEETAYAGLASDEQCLQHTANLQYGCPMTGRRNCKAEERTCRTGCDGDNDDNNTTTT